jgi:hypothetical protein
VLNDGTRILPGPPPGILSPNPPTADGEELTIQLANETVTHTVVTDKTSISGAYSEQVKGPLAPNPSRLVAARLSRSLRSSVARYWVTASK